MSHDATLKKRTVGIGSVCVESGPCEMIAYAIGSCIALCLYDPETNVGAMAHILLPSGSYSGLENKAIDISTKYADHALNRALECMLDSRANPSTIRAAIVGGAMMFPHGGVRSMNIGEMNVASVTEELEKRSIPLCFSVTGGDRSRTVSFHFPGHGFEEQIGIHSPRLC